MEHPGPPDQLRCARTRTPVPRRRPGVATLATCITVALVACVAPATAPTDQAPPEAVVRGVVDYADRFALPPEAVLEVVLQDVTRIGAAPATLARTTIDTSTRPPYRFALAYDPARIDAAGSYAVRATIDVDGERWFMSERAYPVITYGQPSEVAITLLNVGQMPDLYLPATYAGTLACPGCTETILHLDLWQDRTAHLRRTAPPGDATRDDVARWRYRAARGALVLHLASGETLQLEVVDPRTLRVLDEGGVRRPAGSSDLLTSDGRLRPVDLELALAGELSIDADGTSVLACASGRHYPIATWDEAHAVRDAYAALAVTSGAPVLVTLEARLTPDPTHGEPVLVVQRLIGAWDDLDCGSASPTTNLRGSPWRLVRLGDTPVDASGDRRAPTLVLDTDGDHFRSTIGCNALSGAVEADERSLRFGPVTATRRACPPPLDALERTWADALERTTGYRVLATTLELFDDAGSSLALLVTAAPR